MLPQHQEGVWLSRSAWRSTWWPRWDMVPLDLMRCSALEAAVLVSPVSVEQASGHQMHQASVHRMQQAFVHQMHQAFLHWMQQASLHWMQLWLVESARQAGFSAAAAAACGRPLLLHSSGLPGLAFEPAVSWLPPGLLAAGHASAAGASSSLEQQAYRRCSPSTD